MRLAARRSEWLPKPLFLACKNLYVVPARVGCNRGSVPLMGRMELHKRPFRKGVWLVLLVTSALSATEAHLSVTLQGQLGNQMFQIAAVHGQARRLGCAYSVPDLTERSDEAKNGKIGIALNYRNMFFRVPAFSVPNAPVYGEKKWAEYEPLCKVPDSGVRLKGYFQTEKYFEHCAEEIRQLFAPAAGEMEALALRHPVLKLPQKKVGIHVRIPFDPIHDSPHWHPAFGNLYFRKAIEILERTVRCPFKFLVCSNNLEAAKKILESIDRDFHFIESSSRFEDIRILSVCDHVIGSNSSFSWWAAWLGDRPGRTCIFPFPWLRDCKTPADVPDLIPVRWTVIECPEAVWSEDVFETVIKEKGNFKK